MQPTLLSNTWTAAHLPGTKYMGVLCCAGSAGEAALNNSLDETFAEAGYEHLPATLHQRRPPTYRVEGTVAGEDGALATVRRILRSGQGVSDHPLFYQARVFGNAVTLDIVLKAVALDMSSLTGVVTLPYLFMYGYTNLTSVKLPPNIEEFGSSHPTSSSLAPSPWAGAPTSQPST